MVARCGRLKAVAESGTFGFPMGTRIPGNAENVGLLDGSQLRFVLLVVVLLIGPQDATVDSLLKQLGDESLEVREGAQKKLVDLGDKAEAALKRYAESAPAEIGAHCREILKRIEEVRKSAKLVPPIRRITMAAKGRSARDVVKELAAWAAVPVALENVKDVKLEEDLNNLTLFEAIDAVGRKIDMEPFFGVHDSKGKPQSETTAKLRFEDGFVSAPRSYYGHLRVSIRSVEVVKKSDFKQPSEAYTNVELQLDWPLFLAPEGKAEFYITSISDSQGQSIFKADPELQPICFLEPDQDPGYSLWELATIPAAVEGKSLTVKGYALLRFTTKKETARFDNPNLCVGETRKAGAATVTLKGYSSSDGNVNLVVAITDPSPAGFGFDRLRVLTRDGSSPSKEEQKGIDTTTIKKSCFVGKSAVVAVEYIMIRTWHEERFEFELKDVSLPK